MKKNTLLSLGMIAAVAVPVTTVISCGSDDSLKGEAFVKNELENFVETTLTSQLFTPLAIDGTLKDEYDKLGAKWSKEEFEHLITQQGVTLEEITIVKIAGENKLTFSLPEAGEFEVTVSQFAEGADAETVSNVKVIFEPIKTTELSEVAFNALELDGTTTLFDEFENIGYVEDKTTTEARLAAKGTSMKSILVKKIAATTTITYSVAGTDEFSVIFTLFDQSEITDESKVDGVKAIIDTFGALSSTLEQTPFEAVEISESNAVSINGSTETSIPSLGLTIPVFTLNGSTVTMTKAANSAELVFAISNGEAAGNTTISISAFAVPGETADQRVASVIEEIYVANSSDNIKFVSTRTEEELLALVPVEVEWNGLATVISVYEMTPSKAISNMKGTTIKVTLTASTLKLVFTVTDGTDTSISDTITTDITPSDHA